eukprot:CAMPEP_0204499884 /NCGR_PEP_ID=MMETSP0471-20130131/95991_1 /ASSEMBLY_ACC=CAM_ASM_000602 /TAXON_ID=2969 /ORGANISM="Oxyrrhis marina" /LENGTH=48 /DNA_ID= /DNA_START= /DNA_END= /DNA_ORIENTATION=
MTNSTAMVRRRGRDSCHGDICVASSLLAVALGATGSLPFDTFRFLAMA